MPEETTQQVQSEPNVQQERDLLVWNSPSRPFKRRNREFYVTIVAIAGVFGLILFAIDGFLPVLLIVALVFLFYVMSTVEPENIEYKITNMGIKIHGKRTDWLTMGRFWFTKRFDSQLLVIETASLPGRVELVIPVDQKDQINQLLVKYLVHEEVPPSALDKAANWFSKKLPQSNQG